MLRNLNQLFDLLYTKVPPTGFKLGSIGLGKDRVNGLALCRGDVNTTNCMSCVNEESKKPQERCPDKTGAIVWVSFVATLIKLAMATNHVVGGPNGGWDTSSNIQSWASSQKFSVGDNLIFQYPPNHNVVEVTKADYDSCQPTNPIQSYTDGTTTIPLTSPGKRYFICGTMGHCSQGMKVEIDTLASASATSDSPAAESPSPLGSQEISIIPSPSPEESFTPSPSESPEYVPEAPSPLLETHLESPPLSPVIPSTEFPAAASPLDHHSADQSVSSASRGNQRASIAIVLSPIMMLMAF